MPCLVCSFLLGSRTTKLTCLPLDQKVQGLIPGSNPKSSCHSNCSNSHIQTHEFHFHSLPPCLLDETLNGCTQSIASVVPGHSTKHFPFFSFLFSRMPEVLVLLEKVPVLPCLETASSRTGASISLRCPLDSLTSSSTGCLTLYTWMNTQDHKHKLEDVVRDLANGANQVSEAIFSLRIPLYWSPACQWRVFALIW